LESRGHAALDAAQEGVGRRQIVLVREEERHVDRDAGEIASSMAGSPSLVPGILMRRFGRPARGAQGLSGGQRAGGVVGQERRDFQRHPAVDAARPVPDRSERIGGRGQILERQFEEQCLARPAFFDLCPDRGVIGRAVLMAWSKIVGLEVSPVTENSSM